MEAGGTDGPRQISRLIETGPVDQGNVGTHVGIFCDVALEAVADLDLEVFGRDLLEEPVGLRVVAVDDRNELEESVERNCNSRGLHITRNHEPAPWTMQSTR